MNNPFFIKCLKDSEGWWTEGEVYPAHVVAGGFIQVGDDDDPNGEEWNATPVEYREDGSILYQVGGLEGEVLFEESTQ
ncbi:hypothetical protein RO562_000661 [Salmonella enterica]|uniref:Uncharacterized protein n=2 Tax=Salmonella enterica TaxID=28901 RepID=A0A5V0M524_SALER|nr:hypothetical protein [Salmonella enterica]ECS6105759.1 hypothetical protein [Salmonella enterica subsp. enterica serovar Give]ECS7317042.1 hypothetical protein [Salmonella enterica subsp. enterica serovar Miami str. CFSAN000579]EDF6290570.1 hypothetical protein [Salmonella enterica subsp. enterica serovar Newport]EDU6027794.1 hypothetical protein [Salmonella enterica subsp. enterica serovar Brazil]EDV4438956.1 hypothetical protein [Salmonella enterica subsp. enterica serovar Florida]EDV700